jgi:ATP-dependent RNA helicase RhlE
LLFSVLSDTGSRWSARDFVTSLKRRRCPYPSHNSLEALLQVSSFADLNLSPEALKSVSSAGFAHPTPIQTLAIPPGLAGKDVIGVAATGTGKTAAFLLPIIERLAGKSGTRALVLAPTRELALQIGEELDRLARHRRVRGGVVIGGVGMGDQSQAFRERREVIIATPGRLIDHLSQGTAQLGQIEILVLDEADRMLDMGFKPQLTRILARVPRNRQTLLFSATMGSEVADFARQHLKNPTRVEVARSGTTAARVEQQVFLASQQEKLPLLVTLLAEDDLSTLIFTRTKRRADKVAKSLARQGHKVTRIHADRTQGQRRQALDGFKNGTYRILVATDIAARGIDVAEIGHVVNFDMPHVPEDYVHRIGRTARMAASGLASSFASPEEAPLLRGIEKLIRGQIARTELPRGSPIFQTELKRIAEGKNHTHSRGHGGSHSGGATHSVERHNRTVPHPGPLSEGEGGGNGSSTAGARHSGPANRSSRIGSWRPKRRR